MSEMNGHEAQPASQGVTRGRRHSILRFGAVFVGASFVLMLAYYGPLRHTVANDWYMFQVARATSFLLNQIGHSCTVENTQKYRGRETEVRSVLGVSPVERPITPWESWRYQAIMYRRTLGEARKAVEQIERDTTVSADAREQSLAQAKRKLSQLNLRELGPLVSFVWKPADAVQSRALSFSFVLVPDCGAIPSIAIYLAAVLAFPAPWSRRVIGFLAGALLLYVVNIIRLTVLAMIGAWDIGGDVFRFFHEYVWQGVYIIFVIAVWLVWVEFVVRRRA